MYFPGTHPDAQESGMSPNTTLSLRGRRGLLDGRLTLRLPLRTRSLRGKDQAAQPKREH